MLTTSYSAIYSFGDSLSDAGDAYLLTSAYGPDLGAPAEPISPPYYQETYAAPGGGTLAANVFSNGPVWVQDLAAALGLPNPGPGEVGTTADNIQALLATSVGSTVATGIVYSLETAQGHTPGVGNPYLYLVQGAAGGTDFAIGGSITGPNGFNPASSDLTDLQSQLLNFQNEVQTPSAGALYTVWSGSNDLLNLLTSSTFATQGLMADQADTAASAQNVATMVEDLVTEEGAKTILVGSVPNLGLAPEITALGASETTLPATASAFAALFNQDLSTDLQTEASVISGATVDLLNIDGLITSAVSAVATSGSYDVTTPGGGSVAVTNATSPAYTGTYSNNSGSTVAADPDSYLFWDQLHPTATGHQAVADLALSALEAACYCAGTRIRTSAGDVAVETLRAGDLVMVASGAARRVRWVGHRRYAGRFLARNPTLLPIRIEAGALGEGLPARDLLVSAQHALALDGSLIPARQLEGCAGISRVSGLDEVAYFHIELDSHDLLLAEGAPAESFADDASANSFVNAADRPAPGSPPIWCLPRVESGPRLEAIRARLGPVRRAA